MRLSSSTAVGVSTGAAFAEWRTTARSWKSLIRLLMLSSRRCVSLSLEAVKLCGHRRLVEITSPCTLREFNTANEASPEASPGAGSHIEPAKLLFSERGGIAVTDALAGISKPCPIVALVGPEGGWSDDELDMLNAFGCQAVSLGPRVLRTET